MDGATVLAARPNFEPKHWSGGTPPMERHFRSSLAYRLSLIGEGRFDAMLTLRDSWEWDIAAGAFIAQEAGATVTDRRGGALRFNSAVAKTKGVLVAGEVLHREMMSQLKP
jgi:myo-inositol-1(or 4)-monophosphatase